MVCSVIKKNHSKSVRVSLRLAMGGAESSSSSGARRSGVTANVVLSGGYGIGLDAFAVPLAERLGAEIVARAAAKLDDQQMPAGTRPLSQDTEPDVAGLEATSELLLREGANYISSLAATNGPAGTRIYVTSVVDSANARTAASVLVGSMTESERSAALHFCRLVWQLHLKACPAGETLYVYVHYPDQVYERACREHIRRFPELPARSRDALVTFSVRAKRLMDEFYWKRSNMEGHFTVVLDCESDALASPEHQQFIIARISATLDGLRGLKGIWGVPDQEERIRYLRSTEWAGARFIHVPQELTLSTNRPGALDAGQLARLFQRAQVPLPLNYPRAAGVQEQQQQKPTPTAAAPPRAHEPTPGARRSGTPRPVAVAHSAGDE